MLNLRKVAVTGGLSCGKSSVCRFFKELGAYVVSADDIVHTLLSPQKPLGKQVVALLGEKVLKDGKIDREAVAKKVFNDPTALQSLEKLVHPAVFSEIEKQYQQAKIQGTAPLFIAEIPLLFEAHGDPYFDAVIAVKADPKACKQRFKASSGYGTEEFDKRMANQISPDEKARRADHVIDNTGTLQEMQAQVKTLFMKLTKYT